VVTSNSTVFVALRRGRKLRILRFGRGGHASINVVHTDSGAGSGGQERALQLVSGLAAGDEEDVPLARVRELVDAHDGAEGGSIGGVIVGGEEDDADVDRRCGGRSGGQQPVHQRVQARQHPLCERKTAASWHRRERRRNADVQQRREDARTRERRRH